MQDLTAVTGYEIRAEDKTGPGVASARAGLGSLDKAAGDLRGKLAALGGLLSVGMFARAIKEAIDYADALDDLGERTGLSAELLGGLGYAASVTGGNLETIAKGTQKLAANMADAAGGNAKAQATFEALGVSVRNADGSLKSIDGMLLEVADKFAGMEDGAGKAALAQDLLGKSGAELIPFLNAGGEKLRELIEEFRRYGGVSDDVAARAGAFNDTLAKVQMIFGALFREIAAALLPTLQSLADWLVTLKGNGESFRTVADGITVAFKGLAIVAMGVVEAFRAVGKSIGTVLAAIASYLRGDSLSTVWQTLKDGFADVGRSIADTASTAATVWEASTATVAVKTKENLGQRTQAPIAQLKQELIDLADWARKLGSIWDVAFKSPEKPREFVDLTHDAVLAIQRQTTALVEQAQTLGMTSAELIDYRIAQLEAQKAGAAFGVDVEKVNAALDQQIVALRMLKDAQARQDAAKEALAAWQEVEGFAAGFFEDLLTNGRKAFGNLWDNFKRMALQAFAQIAARQLVVNLAGNVTGSSGPGSVAANLLGGGNSGGFLGTLLGGGGGSFLSGIEGMPGFVGPLMPGTFGAGLGAFTSGMLSPFATFGAGFSALGAGGGVSGALAAMGGVAGLAGAALPVVGIALAIASALGAFDRGGPKSGGSASGGADAGTASLIAGTIGRLFTPKGADSTAQATVDAVSQGFLDMARSLGLTAGTAQFALGFDSDPQGDAGSRVSAQAQVNGQTVYSVSDIDVGREEGAVEARLALEAKRVLFAALQASDLPPYLANLFDGIDAAGATAEQIDGILAAASALRVAVDAVQGLDAAFAAMDPADVAAFIDAMGGVDQALAAFSFVADNFLTDTQKLERNTAKLTDGFAALGLEVPTTHAAFLELLAGLDLTTEEGRNLYASISALAPLFVAVRGTAQQAADAIDDQADATEDLVDTVKALVTDLGAIGNAARTEFDRVMAGIEDVVGAMSGTLGDKLTMRMRLISAEIARYQAQLGTVPAGTSDYQGLLDVISRLQVANGAASAELARFTVLAAQYDAARAEQLVALEAWYAEQTRLHGGNATALAALADIFAERWQAIIDGTAGGVDGTLEELERLRASLLDYVKSLALRSDVSPLSPTARLDAAQSAYVDTLGRAQGGDLEALREVQSAADAYLKIARELYASSPQYSAIWQSVVDQLTDLGTPATGGAEPQATDLIADALPVGSPLASQADIAALRDDVAALLARLIDTTREVATGEPIVRELQRTAVAVAESARARK